MNAAELTALTTRVKAITRPEPALLWLYAISALPMLCAWPIAMVPLYFRYHTLWYRFGDEGLAIDLLCKNPNVSKTFSFEMTCLYIGFAEIESPFVQVIFSDGLFDVSISFSKEDLTSKVGGRFVELMRGANKATESFCVREVVCGYEPASDYETRFFTNDVIGPILDKGS